MIKLRMFDILRRTTEYLDKFNLFINNTCEDVMLTIYLCLEKEKKNQVSGEYFLPIELKNNTSLEMELIGEQIADFVSSFKGGKILIKSNIENLNMAYVLNGYALTKWQFDLYKTIKKENVEVFFDLNQDEINEFNNLKINSTAVILCRYLSYIPANKLNPTSYVEFIKKIFEKTNITVEVLEKKELEEKNLNLILAVGQGSSHAPAIVILKKGLKPKTAIVGKGITFDTGGLNIKDSSMLTMYYDMTGSACVLSAMFAIKDLDVEVFGVLPIAENAVSANSYKPGDIIMTRIGKSVEIQNTDAEGRLILADAANYSATDLGCENIICIGTLTGAAKVIFGNEYGALCSRDADLYEALLVSWQKSGEKLYLLPFGEEFEKLAKTERADMGNLSKNGASTILGWLFIKLLCPDSVKYAGIDIASCTSKKYLSKSDPLNNGMCVRGIIEFIKDNCKI